MGIREEDIRAEEEAEVEGGEEEKIGSNREST